MKKVKSQKEKSEIMKKVKSQKEKSENMKFSL